ncbi:MAG: PP2C family serine/threonine-protein phosphatase [Methylococcales bacterium]
MNRDKSDDAMEYHFALCRHILRDQDPAIDSRSIEAFAQQMETRKYLQEMSDRIRAAWRCREKGRESAIVELSKGLSNEDPHNLQSGDRSASETSGAALQSHAESTILTKPDSDPEMPVEASSARHSGSDLKNRRSEAEPPKIRPGQFGGNPVEIGSGEALTRHANVRFKWSNATVNKPYNCRVDIECSEPLEICRIEGLENLGLDYCSTGRGIAGVPTRAGEHRLEVVYRFTALVRQEQRQSVSFIVNHDPKSLWKHLPSDRELLFWKADEMARGLSGHDGWLLAGASKRGRSHANRGACRDDDFVLLTQAKDWHILAVADGAGSSPLSREGARLAVNSAAQSLARQLDEHDERLSEALLAWHHEAGEAHEIAIHPILDPMFTNAIHESLKAIHATAAQQQRPFSDFYTTLLLAAHKQFAGKQLLLGYWIGDGGLVVYEAGQDVILLGESDSGEFAGQTRFLDPSAHPKEQITERIRFDCRDSLTALILMSDGITDPCFETEHNLSSPARWDEFWSDILQPKLDSDPQRTADRLLEWMDFWSPGNHDDRTLVLLYRSELRP